MLSLLNTTIIEVDITHLISKDLDVGTKKKFEKHIGVQNSSHNKYSKAYEDLMK